MALRDGPWRIAIRYNYLLPQMMKWITLFVFVEGSFCLRKGVSFNFRDRNRRSLSHSHGDKPNVFS
jgi:hypothetical protein